MDDLIFGAKTEGEALELFAKARLCLDKAGFMLRKFVSNSLNLQTRVSPQEHQAQVPDRVSVACEDESYTKNTLGERLKHPAREKISTRSRADPRETKRFCENWSNIA